MSRRWAAILLFLGTGGSALLTRRCEVGPDYKEPETKSQGSYEAGAPGAVPDPVVVEWWRSFQDPVLDRLIDRAITGNRDVRTAAALLREARALYSLENYNL